MLCCFAIVAVIWLGWQLLRQSGRLLLRLEELEKRQDELEFGEREEPKALALGTEAPTFELADLTGERKSLAQFRGQSVLLIFFNPDCGYCRELMPKLAEVKLGSRRGNEAESATDQEIRLLTSAATVQPESPRVLILATGDAEKNRQFFAQLKLDCPVLLQEDGEVAKAYQAHGTPTGYLISAEGKIASELAIGAEALLALMAGKSEVRNPKSEQDQSLLTSAATDGDGRASRFTSHSLARSKIKRDGLKAGTPAPDFRLPRLDGRGDLSLKDLRGRRVLLVFSSPHCGPCSALAPALEQFHRDHAEVELVMISRGEPKENRAKVKEHDLTFPVVLQNQWEISRRYAMFATPAAYFIDEQSVITHDVAMGSDAILELMARALPSLEQSASAIR